MSVQRYHPLNHHPRVNTVILPPATRRVTSARSCTLNSWSIGARILTVQTYRCMKLEESGNIEQKKGSPTPLAYRLLLCGVCLKESGCGSSLFWNDHILDPSCCAMKKSPLSFLPFNFSLIHLPSSSPSTIASPWSSTVMREGVFFVGLSAEFG